MKLIFCILGFWGFGVLGFWGRGLQGVDVVDQIVDRASARRGRRDRGDFQHPGDSRQHRPADDQSGEPVGGNGDRSRAANRAQARDQCGTVEFVRFRGHQCFGDPAARGELTRHPTGNHRFAVFGDKS